MVSKEDMKILLKMRQKLYEMGELSEIEIQDACTPALSISTYNKLKPYFLKVFAGQVECEKSRKKQWRFIYTEHQIADIVHTQAPKIQSKIDDKL